MAGITHDEQVLLPSILLVGLTTNVFGYYRVFVVPERLHPYPPDLAEDVIQVRGHVRVPTTHVEPDSLYVGLLDQPNKETLAQRWGL